MDLGCYPLHMISYFSGMTPRVVSATAETGPAKIDIAMDVEFELPGGVPARMNSAMRGCGLNATFTARGDRGEFRVINPIAPHRGHQLTVKTTAGEKKETVPGDTTYTHQFARVRGGGTRRSQISHRRRRRNHQHARHRRDLSRGRAPTPRHLGRLRPPKIASISANNSLGDDFRTKWLSTCCSLRSRASARHS